MGIRPTPALASPLLTRPPAAPRLHPSIARIRVAAPTHVAGPRLVRRSRLARRLARHTIGAVSGQSARVHVDAVFGRQEGIHNARAGLLQLHVRRHETVGAKGARGLGGAPIVFATAHDVSFARLLAGFSGKLQHALEVVRRLCGPCERTALI